MRKARIDNEGILDDIHERNDEFMKKVYQNANFVANYFNWTFIECNKDGQMKSINDIHEEIYRLVKKIK